MDQRIALKLRTVVAETVGTRAAMCLGAKGMVRFSRDTWKNALLRNTKDGRDFLQTVLVVCCSRYHCTIVRPIRCATLEQLLSQRTARIKIDDNSVLVADHDVPWVQVIVSESFGMKDFETFADLVKPSDSLIVLEALPHSFIESLAVLGESNAHDTAVRHYAPVASCNGRRLVLL